MMGAALIFLMLCWQIPKLFSAVLGGAPALTGGDLWGPAPCRGRRGGRWFTGGWRRCFAARGAAAISGVGAAAGAGGSGAGTSAAGVGAAGRGVAGLPEVVSCRRHRRRLPVHPETVDQDSQTRPREMVVLAVHPRTLRESARVLAEDRLQFATARAVTRARMGTEQRIHPPSLRHCHRLAATISPARASRASDLRAVSRRLPTSIPPSPVRSGFVSDAVLGTDSASSVRSANPKHGGRSSIVRC